MPRTCGSISGSLSEHWPYHWRATFTCKEHKIGAETTGRSLLGRKRAVAAYTRALSQVFRVAVAHKTTLEMADQRSQSEA